MCVKSCSQSGVDTRHESISIYQSIRKIHGYVVISDNFKTFKSSVVKKFMLRLGVQQKFTLPASPWWGGFYERLVRSVKMLLKKMLEKSLSSYEKLETVLLKIESVINGRPLAFLSEDDLCDAFTPTHLMYGRNIRTKINAAVPESIL